MKDNRQREPTFTKSRSILRSSLPVPARFPLPHSHRCAVHVSLPVRPSLLVPSARTGKASRAGPTCTGPGLLT